MKNEIVFYQPGNLVEHIEVKIEDETVWLTLNQIAQLFNRDKSVISRHLKNIYKEGELIQEATVAKNATVQIESGRTVKREIEYYNLDIIISVGYRVNSKQGTQFRIWATNILRDYLLKGYAINNRINRIEDKIEKMDHLLSDISLQLKTHELPTQGIFFDGQIFDAYAFIAGLIKKAKSQIILIDNYIDESTLTHLSKKQKNVKVILLTKNISKGLLLDIKKANDQFGNFEVSSFNASHDRFIILDETEIYHLGASLKDLGKKWFAFSKLNEYLLAIILKEIHLQLK
jgi:hypothetical protein